MANLHLLSKSKYGALDEERAILSAMGVTRDVNISLPVYFGKKMVAHVGHDKKKNRVWAAPFPTWDSVITNTTAAIPQLHDIYINKSCPANLMVTNNWYDLWPLSSDPVGGTYPGVASSSYVHSATDYGVPALGPALSTGQTRHILGCDFHCTALTSVKGTFVAILYDRVMVYNSLPLTNGTNTLTNTILPTRYGGQGVQVMLTEQTPQGGSWSILSYNYVNDVGTTRTYTLPSSISAAFTNTDVVGPAVPALITMGNLPGPFLGRNSGDLGVYQLTSYTIASSSPTGTVCLALVRPLAIYTSPAANIWNQFDELRQLCNLIPLASDAVLSICTYNGGTAGDAQFEVNLTTAWG